jgi:hypothetical protein
VRNILHNMCKCEALCRRTRFKMFIRRRQLAINSYHFIKYGTTSSFFSASSLFAINVIICNAQEHYVQIMVHKLIVSFRNPENILQQVTVNYTRIIIKKKLIFIIN